MTKTLAVEKKKRNSLGVKPQGSQVIKKKAPKGNANSPMNGKGTPKGQQKQGKGKVAGKEKKKQAKNDEDEEEEEELKSGEESSEMDVSGDEVAEKNGVQMFKGVPKEDDDDSDEENEEEDNGNDSDEDSDIAAEFANDSAASGVSIDIGSDDDEDDSAAEEEEEEEDSSDDDDDSDEEDEAEDVTKKGLGLSALLGDSIVDDEDDESFKDDDEGDDDDEISDDGDEETSVNVSKVSEAKEDEKDESTDDDSEDEDETSKVSLKDLLGESLVSDDDEEEFDGEEESDEEDEESDDEDEVEEPKPKQLSEEEKLEENKRTIFVSNVPKDIVIKNVKKIFKEYGEIESMRLRGIVPETPQMSLKAAAITKKMHPKVQTVTLYIKYKDESMAKKALAMNGKNLGENIVGVDMAISEKKDPKKAVMVGNLPYSKFFSMLTFPERTRIFISPEFLIIFCLDFWKKCENSQKFM